MNKGQIISKGSKYIARIIIGGKLYEKEAPTKKAAQTIIEKLLKENKPL